MGWMGASKGADFANAQMGSLALMDESDLLAIFR